jgi:hypothetical protein
MTLKDKRLARDESTPVLDQENGSAHDFVSTDPPILTCEEAHMSDDKTPTELNRGTAEKGRKDAEDLRKEADQARDSAEVERASAESARKEAEQFRVLAEEARVLREQYREELESVRREREALSTNLAQMQFLEDARNTLKQLKPTKPSDVH